MTIMHQKRTLAIMHQKTTEDQEHVKNTVATFPFDAPPLAARSNFCPNPIILPKMGKKTLLTLNNTRTTISTNEQRTTFRLAMNTHLTFSYE